MNAKSSSSELVSSWVLRKVKAVSRIVGVSFERFEEKAMRLFEEIERKRREEGEWVVGWDGIPVFESEV